MANTPNNQYDRGMYSQKSDDVVVDAETKKIFDQMTGDGLISTENKKKSANN